MQKAGFREPDSLMVFFFLKLEGWAEHMACWSSTVSPWGLPFLVSKKVQEQSLSPLVFGAVTFIAITELEKVDPQLTSAPAEKGVCVGEVILCQLSVCSAISLILW